MNTRQFDYLLSVAEYKNFGLAANKCNITQSTLSTMIGRFEDEIGINIFDRKTKPVSITKEGIVIINQLKRIVNEIDVLEELTQTIKGELVGEIKIGIIPTVAPFVLPEFLNDFTKNFPNINFIVSEMTTDLIVNLLERRELDIGILAIPLKRDLLQELPLYNESFFLFDCREGVKVRKRGNLEKIDFEKFWLLEEGHCFHTQVKRICDFNIDKAKEGINFDFKAGSIESLIRFVKKNKGITMLPYLSSLTFTEEEQQKITLFKPPVPVRTIGLITHKHFVKKNILSLLHIEIRNKIVPLLKTKRKAFVINPF